MSKSLFREMYCELVVVFEWQALSPLFLALLCKVGQSLQLAAIAYLFAIVLMRFSITPMPMNMYMNIKQKTLLVARFLVVCRKVFGPHSRSLDVLRRSADSLVHTLVHTLVHFSATAAGRQDDQRKQAMQGRRPGEDDPIVSGISVLTCGAEGRGGAEGEQRGRGRIQMKFRSSEFHLNFHCFSFVFQGINSDEIQII